MPVFRDVKPGDVLRIGDTVIEVEYKSGARARLRIDSPLEVKHQMAQAASMTRPAPIAPTTAPRDAVASHTLPRLTRPSLVAG